MRLSSIKINKKIFGNGNFRKIFTKKRISRYLEAKKQNNLVHICREIHGMSLMDQLDRMEDDLSQLANAQYINEEFYQDLPSDDFACIQNLFD